MARQRATAMASPNTRSEQHLDQSESGYRLLFDRNPWPMWVYDSQTLRFLAANQAAVTEYGYSEQAFLAMRLPDIRPEGDQEALRQHLALPEHARLRIRHWRHRRSDGTLLDVEIASAAIDFAGRPARLVQGRDITERLRAEAALRHSERRYRNIVETAIEGIWTIDAQARTSFVNPTMAQMLGYSVHEMLGRALTDFMDDEGVAITEANLVRRRQGVAEQHEFKFRRKDGSDLWVAMATNRILDDAEGYAGALAMVTDITERRQIEARERSRDRVMTLIAGGAPLPELLDAIVLGVEASQPGLVCSLLLLDGSGTRLMHSAAPSLPAFFTAAANGLAIGPLLGSCGGAAALGQRVISEHIPSDERWLPYRDLAAQAGLVACWSEPVISATGVVLGTLGVYHRQRHRPDTAEIATVTEAAKMTAIALEYKRADDALRESQKMQALGTLAGGVAHDFNNILGAILGQVALAAQAGADQPGMAARLAQIQQSALRARDLVQQILAFGRRQPRQARYQPLGPLVHDAMGLLRATLPASVRLVANLAAEPLQAEVDATQIQQVLVNLCTNAWHAMADAGGQIQIGLAPLYIAAGQTPGPAGLAAGHWAHLWVQDDGSGMDDAMRARIFEPFFNTKPVGRGTGQGLAVVHGIVMEHGGAITVDSAIGQGATFHLYFPAAPGGAELSAAPDPGLATVAAPPNTVTVATASAGAGRHILCVDDDPVILLTDEGLLGQQGYRVTCLGSGAEAVAALRAAPDRFDLVLTDFNMPGMSGLALAREIAAIRSGLPVVICSGYIDAELRQRAAELGVRALVPKEQTVEARLQTISLVLGQAGPA